MSDFQQTFDFYTRYFNLKATDILTAPNGAKVAAFMHVDREEEWVDHHTFFFSVNANVGPHHCSYEVHDPDAQSIGHDVSSHGSGADRSGSKPRATRPHGEWDDTSSAPRSSITGTPRTTS